MPGGVDQLQLVGVAVGGGEEHTHGLGLDRDATLALEVHRVEQLRAHLARSDGVGELEDAIGQRGLAVVDVGDNREVADVALVHGLLQRRGRDLGGNLAGPPAGRGVTGHTAGGPDTQMDPLAFISPADRLLDGDPSGSNLGNAQALGPAASPGVESVKPPRQRHTVLGRK